MENNNMIYLDNSAGSHPKPPAVAAAMAAAINEYGANPGRGNYAMSRHTSAFVEKAREKLADFFHLADPRQVIFTAGATMSLNMGLRGLLSDGKKLLLCGMEHNAVSRPAAAMSDSGMISVCQLFADSCGNYRLAYIASKLAYGDISLMAVTHGSNVNGAVVDLPAIAALARKSHTPLLLDAAQTGGLLPLDMRKLPRCAVSIAGHKGLFGPAGIGVLLVQGLELQPLLLGGTGIRSEERLMPRENPEHLEAGSINVAGIAGLMAGLDFVEQTGIEQIYDHSCRLTRRLAEMAGNIAGMELYLPAGGVQLPVLALNIKGLDPAEVAAWLDSRYGVCVRSGYHCAPAAHRALGTMESGSVRFSPSWFNTMEDIEHTARALEEIARGRRR